MGKKAARNASTERKAMALAPLETLVFAAEKVLPGRRMGLWLEAFLHPEKTIDSEHGKATFGNTLVHLVLIGLMAGLVMGVSLVISSFFDPQMALLSLQKGLVRIFIADLLIALGIGFVFSAVLCLLARLFEGKGKYMEQAHGIALVYGGQILVSALFNLLAGIPILGAIMFPILLAIGVYALYNYYLVVKHVQRISGFRTAIIMAVSLLLLMAAGILLASAIAASMAATV
jgi:hypothetical protein